MGEGARGVLLGSSRKEEEWPFGEIEESDDELRAIRGGRETAEEPSGIRRVATVRFFGTSFQVVEAERMELVT